MTDQDLRQRQETRDITSPESPYPSHPLVPL